MTIKSKLTVVAIVVSVLSAIVGLADDGTTLRKGPGRGSAQDQVANFPSTKGTDGTMTFDGATGWLNSAPLSLAGLRGSVVLVEFWTYTCINWRRQLPYTRAWADKYRDKGLVVIGVHSPEFEFEKSIENVRRASQSHGIAYPVAVDSDHAIWRAFRNAYWPALYFVDAKGRIRHRQFGEGGYERAEQVLQELLVEAGATGITPERAVVRADGAEAAADFANLRSPETYLGSGRSAGFGSGARNPRPHSAAHAFPAIIGLNQWALAGEWKIEREAAVLTKPRGRIAYVFHARDLHLVMGPSEGRPAVRFRVSVDGAVPGSRRGTDTDEQGNGVATERRMYQLIRQSSDVGQHRFEIEFLDADVEVYAFTFG